MRSIIKSIQYLLVVVFFGLMAVTPVEATMFYVSPNGADTNNGTSTATAWKTLTKAAASVAAGDTVNVLDGTYPGDFTISKSGTTSQPITFQGSSNTKLITGKTQADASVWIKGNYVVLKNFDIEGNVAVRGLYNRVEQNKIHNGWEQSGISLAALGKDTADTAYNTIINNTISYPVGAGIYIRGQFNEIIGNEISHTQDHSPGQTTQTDDADGMRFFGHGHKIKHNYIHDVWQSEANGTPHIDMIQTWEAAYDILFDGNIFHNPNPSGSNRILMLERQPDTGPVSNITWVNNIFIFADDSSAFMNFNRKSGQPEIVNMIVVNNTFYYDGDGSRSGDKAATFDNITNPVFRNNLLIDASDGSGGYVELVGLASTTGDVGNNAVFSTYGINPGTSYPNDVWRVDPQVVDRDMSDGVVDFHLRANSPLIDRVLGATFTNVDLDGVSRPYGSKQDIGAYEYTGNPVISITPIPSPLPTTGVDYDLNNDGHIDFIDYLILVKNFNQNTCGIVGDLNQDCKVNLVDFNLLFSSL